MLGINGGNGGGHHRGVSGSCMIKMRRKSTLRDGNVIQARLYSAG